MDNKEDNLAPNFYLYDPVYRDGMKPIFHNEQDQS